MHHQLVGDKSFHIRHQRIEEDWIQNPSFMKMGAHGSEIPHDALGEGV